MKRDIISIRDMDTHTITQILDLARQAVSKVTDRTQRDESLKGASVSTLFFENSTRTKLSFLLAAEYLGAYADDLNISTSSVNKGETLIDTGKTLDSMGTDVMIIRHDKVGAAHLLARSVGASVINGGDGSNEHPTQALLDMFTIQERLGSLKDVNVTIVGDIASSRVARSNVFGLVKMGAHVTLAGPSTMVSSGMSHFGAKVTHDVKTAVKGADVIMGLRVQLERHQGAKIPTVGEYARYFGVNKEVLAQAKKGALIMHPGPTNRGVEMTAQVLDSEHAVVYDQVKNGVAVRMACLQHVMEGR